MRDLRNAVLRHWRAGVVLAVMCGAPLCGMQNAAAQVLNLTGGEPADTQFNGTLGWEFTTNQAVEVTALDAFSTNGNGLVYIYNSAGDVLASATVTSADPQEGTGVQFYRQTITPVLLNADTTYFIAEDAFARSTGLFIDATGLSVNAAITFDTEIIGGTLGGTPTTDGFGGAYNPGAFGPDFDIAVPEAPSLVVLGGALVALAAARRRR